MPRRFPSFSMLTICTLATGLLSFVLGQALIQTNTCFGSPDDLVVCALNVSGVKPSRNESNHRSTALPILSTQSHLNHGLSEDIKPSTSESMKQTDTGSAVTESGPYSSTPLSTHRIEDTAVTALTDCQMISSVFVQESDSSHRLGNRTRTRLMHCKSSKLPSLNEYLSTTFAPTAGSTTTAEDTSSPVFATMTSAGTASEISPSQSDGPSSSVIRPSARPSSPHAPTRNGSTVDFSNTTLEGRKSSTPMAETALYSVVTYEVPYSLVANGNQTSYVAAEILTAHNGLSFLLSTYSSGGSNYTSNLGIIVKDHGPTMPRTTGIHISPISGNGTSLVLTTTITVSTNTTALTTKTSRLPFRSTTPSKITIVVATTTTTTTVSPAQDSQTTKTEDFSTSTHSLSTSGETVSLTESSLPPVDALNTIITPISSTDPSAPTVGSLLEAEGHKSDSSSLDPQQMDKRDPYRAGYNLHFWRRSKSSPASRPLPPVFVKILMLVILVSIFVTCPGVEALVGSNDELPAPELSDDIAAATGLSARHIPSELTVDPKHLLANSSLVADYTHPERVGGCGASYPLYCAAPPRTNVPTTLIFCGLALSLLTSIPTVSAVDFSSCAHDTDAKTWGFVLGSSIALSIVAGLRVNIWPLLYYGAVGAAIYLVALGLLPRLLAMVKKHNAQKTKAKEAKAKKEASTAAQHQSRKAPKDNHASSIPALGTIIAFVIAAILLLIVTTALEMPPVNAQTLLNDDHQSTHPNQLNQSNQPHPFEPTESTDSRIPNLNTLPSTSASTSIPPLTETHSETESQSQNKKKKKICWAYVSDHYEEIPCNTAQLSFQSATLASRLAAASCLMTLVFLLGF